MCVPIISPLKNLPSEFSIVTLKMKQCIGKYEYSWILFYLFTIPVQVVASSKPKHWLDIHIFKLVREYETRRDVQALKYTFDGLSNVEIYYVVFSNHILHISFF